MALASRLLLTFSANETDKSNAPLIVLGRVLIGMLWVGWAAYWIVAARHPVTNRRTESLLTGVSYRVLLALGVILLASPGYHLSLANFFLWPQSRLHVGHRSMSDNVRAEHRSLGATSPREVLERSHYSEGGSPRDPKRALRIRAASDL